MKAMESIGPGPWRRRLLLIVGAVAVFAILTSTIAWTHSPTCAVDSRSRLLIELLGYGSLAAMIVLLLAAIAIGVMWIRHEGTIASLLEVVLTLAVSGIIAAAGIGAIWLGAIPWCEAKRFI